MLFYTKNRRSSEEKICGKTGQQKTFKPADAGGAVRNG